MSLIGLQLYITLKLKSLIPKEKTSLFSILLGIIIPEINSIFLFFNNGFNNSLSFNKSITHSLITVAAIYLLFLIIYEIKKNQKILLHANGITIGIIINIAFNCIIRLDNIDILWPLPIQSIQKHSYSNSILNLLLCLEFIFFRLLGSELINLMINESTKDNTIIHLSYFMKFATIFTFLLILTTISTSYLTTTIFIILYNILYLYIFYILLRLRKIL